MKSVLANVIAFIIVAAFSGCSVEPEGAASHGEPAVSNSPVAAQIVERQPSTPAPVDWAKTPISHEFEGRTVSLEVGNSIYFFHGKTLSIYQPETNVWEHRDETNPYQVDGQFAVTFDQQTGIYILSGINGRFYRLNIQTNMYDELAPVPSEIYRGPRVESDGGNFIYAATGYKEKSPVKGTLYRYDVADNSWEPKGKIKTVNTIGKYSSGLSYWENKLYAWGDHHVSYFDLEANEWGKSIFWPMRYRPPLGRGGMYTIDREAGAKYVTLGRGSNSIGLLDIRNRGFFYLRPRMPFLLDEDDDTLFLSKVNGEKRINVLANSEKAIYSIDVNALETIHRKSDDKSADVGSPWVVHNVVPRGAGGELIRHKDSFTNSILAPPFIYNQRKNILRRYKIKNGAHSWVGGCCGPRGKAFKFHKKFIASGAGIAYDDERYFYLFSGHDKQFFKVDLWGGVEPKPKTPKRKWQAEAEDIKVSTLASLPEAPASNTAITYHDGAVWAVFSPETRNLYRYEPEQNLWKKVADLPSAAIYDTTHGFVLTSSGDTLYLAAKNALFTYQQGGAQTQPWEMTNAFDFSFYADGGMVASDQASNRFFVSVGNGTSSLAIVDPEAKTSSLHALEFPDVVSVAGQRMFVHSENLYIVRGHNSGEVWRTPTTTFE